MIDWDRYTRLLTDGTNGAVQRFFAQHPGIELSAIGFTFELWNHSPAFNLCANTHTYFRAVKERYRTEWPNTDCEQLRWNSGDYEFCAGLLTDPNELGAEWESEYIRLHELANENLHSRDIYEGLVRISCCALAKLVNCGMIGKWNVIDFNVAEYGDDIDLIKDRDRIVRSLIARDGSPLSWPRS
jgi:hypothetical protein